MYNYTHILLVVSMVVIALNCKLISAAALSSSSVGGSKSLHAESADTSMAAQLDVDLLAAQNSAAEHENVSTRKSRQLTYVYPYGGVYNNNAGLSAGVLYGGFGLNYNPYYGYYPKVYTYKKYYPIYGFGGVYYG